MKLGAVGHLPVSNDSIAMSSLAPAPEGERPEPSGKGLRSTEAGGLGEVVHEPKELPVPPDRFLLHKRRVPLQLPPALVSAVTVRTVVVRTVVVGTVVAPPPPPAGVTVVAVVVVVMVMATMVMATMLQLAPLARVEQDVPVRVRRLALLDVLLQLLVLLRAHVRVGLELSQPLAVRDKQAPVALHLPPAIDAVGNELTVDDEEDAIAQRDVPNHGISVVLGSHQSQVVICHLDLNGLPVQGLQLLP